MHWYRETDGQILREVSEIGGAGIVIRLIALLRRALADADGGFVAVRRMFLGSEHPARC